MTVNEALDSIYYSTSPLWSTPYAGVPRRLVTAKSYHFHPARITIKHWQLRDLVSVSTERPSLVYYPTDNKVNSIDLAASAVAATASEEGQVRNSIDESTPGSPRATRTSQAEVVAEFEFEPRSIQNLNNIVAVAGVKSTREQAGKIGVVNRVSGAKIERELGQYINNSLCLYTDYDDESIDNGYGGDVPKSNSNSAMHALVCNNDKNLYWLNIGHERIEIEREMPFPASLNHASISPDRKMIVACGDIGQVYLSPAHETRANSKNIFQLNDGSGSLAGSGAGSTINAYGKSKSCSYQNWQTLETWPDYGFSTSFHSSSIVFGVAFQPGVAQLFDVRNLSEPLTQIYSTRPKDWTGAFRCLKFASGPQDLVFISEQMGRVHLVDLRNFDNHQVLNVPDRAGRWQRDEEQPAVQFYDDMLKSGEASPLVMNNAVAHNEHYPAPEYNGGGYATGDSLGSDNPSSNLMMRRTRRLSVESASGIAAPSIGGSTGSRRGSASIRELSMDGVPLTPEPFDIEPPPALLQGPSTRQRRYSLRYLSNRPDLQPSSPTSSGGMAGLRGGLMGGSMATAASHLAAHTENGVSGLGWSGYNGGTLIVGTDCGVATWSIDQIARRTFPDYERR